MMSSAWGLRLAPITVAMLLLAFASRAGEDHSDGDHAGHACLGEGEAHAAPKDGDQNQDEHDGHDHGDSGGGEPGRDEPGHEGHDHEAHAEIIEIDPDILASADMRIAVAERGSLASRLTIPGEVKLNQDHVVHVTPRVPGIVKSVTKSVGDEAGRGEILAVLESGELAEAKAALLAAQVRAETAGKKLARERDLWESQAGSEAEVLEAREAHSEAANQLRAIRQRLLAMGLSESYLEELAAQPEESYMRYEMISPIQGTVIEKHLARGEMRRDDEEAFVLADLSTVWVDLRVYQKDLPLLHAGQAVSISAGPGGPSARAEIRMISPAIDEHTRTALARVIMPNPQGSWRPGLFVTAEIFLENDSESVLIPRDAAQTIDAEPVVFVSEGAGFRPQPVRLGRSDRTRVEVLAGLEPGQRYVAQGAFALKARIVTSGMDAHAGHGH